MVAGRRGPTRTVPRTVIPSPTHPARATSASATTDRRRASCERSSTPTRPHAAASSARVRAARWQATTSQETAAISERPSRETRIPGLSTGHLAAREGREGRHLGSRGGREASTAGRPEESTVPRTKPTTHRLTDASCGINLRDMSKPTSKTEIAKSLRAAVAASLAAGKPGATVTAAGRSIDGAWIDLDGALVGYKLRADEYNKHACQRYPSRDAALRGPWTVEFPVGSHLDYVARVLAERFAKAAA